MNKREKIAFISTVFKENYSTLYRYGMRLTSRHELVEEAIQELFIELLSYKNQLHQVQNIQAYLLVAFRKKLFKIIKKETAFQNRNEKATTEYIQFNQEDFLIKGENKQFIKAKLTNAINDLPNRQKELIHLKYYAGLDNKEIAQVMNITYQGVINMLFKAMKKLRQKNFFIFF